MSRYLVFSILSLFLHFSLSGQYALTGRVLDSAGNGVAYATLTLCEAIDSSLVKGDLSDEEGRFEISTGREGEYILIISAIGFETWTSPPIQLHPPDAMYDMGILSIQTASNTLDEVTVTSQKPFIERRPDKLIVNVENSIVSAGASALEVLEQSPNVLIDQNGNISLKGRQGVIVMMDGKRLHMTGEDLANMLRAMPSSTISTIEIITNPSAKYDAEGSAGIIDLKTKKGQKLGINGSTTLSGGYGKYPKANASLHLNYREAKWNLYSNYSYNYNKIFNNLLVDRHYQDVEYKNLLYDQNSLLVLPYKTHNAQSGVDYFLSEKTTVGAMLSGHSTGFDPRGDNETIVRDGDAELGSFLTTNRSSDAWHHLAGNVNVNSALDSNGRELSLDLDYARYWNQTDQEFNTAFFGLASPPSILDFLLGDIGGKLNLYSVKADYTHPMGTGGILEGGIKSSFVRNNNELLYFIKEGGELIPDIGRSNHFIYDEQINAAYANWNLDSEKWSYQAGIRAEQTRADGLQVTIDSSFSRNYWQLFPSAFLQYKYSEEHSFGISVSRRINRPNYRQLNPFRSFVDLTTYREGNPFLSPQLTWAFELTHSYRQRLHTTLSYLLTSDDMASVMIQNDQEKQTVLTFINLRRFQYLSLNSNFSFDPVSWWNCRLDLNVFYQDFKGNVSGNGLESGGSAFYINYNNSLKLPWEVSMEISGMYMSRHVYNISTIHPIWTCHVGFQKKILDRKGNLRLNLRDIFYTGWPSGSTQFANIDETFESRRETRVVTLSFTYHFGNQNVPGSRKRQSGAADEMRRAERG